MPSLPRKRKRNFAKLTAPHTDRRRRIREIAEKERKRTKNQFHFFALFRSLSADHPFRFFQRKITVAFHDVLAHHIRKQNQRHELKNDKLSQRETPIHKALEEQRINRLAHFDVPGHKGGRGNRELTEFLGEDTMSLDMNSMKPLDNLNHPVSVIKDAHTLAAEAFGADEAFFIVNGTTAAVQAMIMAACNTGEKIIMPRNVHRSAINALVVCGALPAYINPGINKELGIPLGMSIKDVKRAIDENPDAKAILVNNPTYYGICSNLPEIAALAHAHNMLVLVDEAHGTHFYFNDKLPVSAIDRKSTRLNSSH